jgi:hypothetical protein
VIFCRRWPGAFGEHREGTLTTQAVGQSISQSIEVRAAIHSESTGRSCAEDVDDDGVFGACSPDETLSLCSGRREEAKGHSGQGSRMVCFELA